MIIIIIMIIMIIMIIVTISARMMIVMLAIVIIPEPEPIYAVRLYYRIYIYIYYAGYHSDPNYNPRGPDLQVRPEPRGISLFLKKKSQPSKFLTEVPAEDQTSRYGRSLAEYFRIFI